MGPGDFTVLVSVVPALSFGEKLELILDNELYLGNEKTFGI